MRDRCVVVASSSLSNRWHHTSTHRRQTEQQEFVFHQHWRIEKQANWLCSQQHTQYGLFSTQAADVTSNSHCFNHNPVLFWVQFPVVRLYRITFINMQWNQDKSCVAFSPCLMASKPCDCYCTNKSRRLIDDSSCIKQFSVQSQLASKKPSKSHFCIELFCSGKHKRDTPIP